MQFMMESIFILVRKAVQIDGNSKIEAHRTSRLKGNSPCPRLFLCQTSGRSPGLWFILRTSSRFRSDFFVLCPRFYSRGSCGGFSPHFPDGLSFFCTRPPFFQMLQVFSWAFKRVSLFVWFRNTFLLHCNVCISIYLSPVVSVSAKEGITRYRTQPT